MCTPESSDSTLKDYQNLLCEIIGCRKVERQGIREITEFLIPLSAKYVNELLINERGRERNGVRVISSVDFRLEMIHRHQSVLNLCTHDCVVI